MILPKNTTTKFVAQCWTTKTVPFLYPQHHHHLRSTGSSDWRRRQSIMLLRRNYHNNNNNNQQQHHHHPLIGNSRSRRSTIKLFGTLHNGFYSRMSSNTLTNCSSVVFATAVAVIVSSYYHSSVDSTATTLLEPIQQQQQPSPHLLGSRDDDDDECRNKDSSIRSNSTSPDDQTTILNWSGTHSVQVLNDHYWEPESIAEVERIVQLCHSRGQSIRPIGSALSPNGIGFNPDGMISMIHLDEILHIDPDARTVTVQAGARVSQVVDALRSHHLTLPNLASIAEQQMGGFVQVGAHGTGKRIAPVDHYVTQLKLVTPSRGPITLTKDDGELFHMAKVGLGCLGVVVEVTMSCIPAHQLREHTFVLTRQQAKEQVDTLLQNHKHMRYMWIPHTDTVVCVTNDPIKIDETVSLRPVVATESKSSNVWFRSDQRSNVDDATTVTTPSKSFQNNLSTEERLQPMVDLLLQLSAEVSTTTTTTTTKDPLYTQESISGMGFAALRDAILSMNDPLNIHHVQRCNRAEAEFWKRNEGYIIKNSDELLQFDCGGQQWVWEVCFPTGTQETNNGNDMRFMEQLLEGIETNNIPAHAPIEQRWSASSSSYMSPAYGPSDGLHSWVGIINYLPSTGGTLTPEQEMLQRQSITTLFTGTYCDLMRKVGYDVNATSHWAKLEPPKSFWDLIDLHLFLSTRFPLDKFNAYRGQLDPNNILASPLLNALLGKPKPSS